MPQKGQRNSALTPTTRPFGFTASPLWNARLPLAITVKGEAVPNQIAMREERSVDLNIRIRPSLKKELEWRAGKEGSTLSNWIERTLEARVDSPTLIPSPTPAPLVPMPELPKPDRQRQAPAYLLQIVALSALSWASIFLVVGMIFALPTLVLTAACAIGLLLSLLALEDIFRRFWQQTGPTFGDWTKDRRQVFRQTR